MSTAASTLRLPRDFFAFFVLFARAFRGDLMRNLLTSSLLYQAFSEGVVVRFGFDWSSASHYTRMHNSTWYIHACAHNPTRYKYAVERPHPCKWQVFHLMNDLSLGKRRPWQDIRLMNGFSRAERVFIQHYVEMLAFTRERSFITWISCQRSFNCFT